METVGLSAGVSFVCICSGTNLQGVRLWGLVIC
jgi:hypothetical protein